MLPGREQRYWAFAANPRKYRIEDAVHERDTDLWTTKGREIKVGDRAIIWKTGGGGRKRGIVAFAEVITNPEVRRDASNPYWLDPQAVYEMEERALVRYVLAPALPLWLGDQNAVILGELSVSRASGGTIFHVTPEQWEEVVEAAGGWPS